MLAFRPIPENYARWNWTHGAPHGRHLSLRRWQKWFLSAEQIETRRGPFALQPNNSIREFEYPWAFHVPGLEPGMQVLELGGGLGGFQFVLDAFGCRVVNVDPGMETLHWLCNQASMQKLNRRFGARVELRNTTIEKAELSAGSFDRAFCISVLEHLPPAAATGAMQHIHRCLKPGRLFVLTTDLFLNLSPFCSRLENEFGRNQNVRALIDDSAWELVAGERAQLYGFPEFNPDSILCQLEKFLVGGYYPGLAQCLVLKKR
jgi:2-polyprenyl-3-methyl-5-hydroxy-6-metoxy-1,4-benzoquinol methylase